jgi:hypothetical protein
MSSNKYIDKICIFVTALTVIITLVFMNSANLGVVAVTSDAVADNDGIFSDRDLNPEWDSDTATYIQLDDMDNLETAGAYALDGNLHIVSKGVYVLSGSLENHQIIVNAKSAKIQIVLNGVTIDNESLSAVYVKKADKVFLTLAEGSENTLTTKNLSEETDDIDAAIYSKSDLTINGTGTLTVKTEAGHGIKTVDDLVITGGNITVNAAENALLGKDSVRICDGVFTLTAGKDGIKANNDSNEEKGYVTITGGTFVIEAANDGIQAETKLNIEGGDFNITTNGGYVNGRHTTASAFGGQIMENADGWQKDKSIPTDMLDNGNGMEMAEGSDEMPEGGGQMPEGSNEMAQGNGQMPEGNGQMPQGDGEMPQGDGEMPEGGGQMPEGDDEMPEGGGQMPEGSNEMAQGNGQMPEGNDQMPQGDGEMPQGDDDMSSGRNGMMKGNREMPGGGAGMSGQDMEEETESSDTSADSGSDSYKGIKAGTQLTINGGTFNLDCADDGLHSNGDLTITAGTFNIASGDDGMHADDELLISGGEITISQSYEGIEGNKVEIVDGTIDVTSSDDGMNASGGSNGFSFGGMGGFAGNSSDDESSTDENEETELPLLHISGGVIHVSADGDGLDSNGDLIIDGGDIVVDGPSDSSNGALDSGTESGGDCIVNGGTIIALGASGMAETFTENSTQYSFECTFTSSFAKGDILKITNADGQLIYSYTIQKSGNSIVFSSPELQEGGTYTVTVGDLTNEVTLDSISVGASTGVFNPMRK